MKPNSQWMYAFWAFMLVFTIIELGSSGSGESGSPGQGQAFAVFSNILAYCWFAADAREEGHSPSRGLKLGVFFLNIIFVPYYLLRVKGWRRSLRSVGKFLLLLLAFLACAVGFDLMQ